VSERVEELERDLRDAHVVVAALVRRLASDGRVTLQGHELEAVMDSTLETMYDPLHGALLIRLTP
jgi:hypothetical protein